MMMLRILRDDEEFIIDSFDFRICQTIFHRQRRELAASIAGCTASGQCINGSILCHIPDVTGMQPTSAVRMQLNYLCSCYRIIISEHRARAALTDFSHRVVSQFLICARLENRNIRQRQRYANIAVSDRLCRHRQRHIRTGFTTAITSRIPNMTVVVIQEFLCALELNIIVCLTAGSCRNQMRKVIIIRYTAIAHDQLNKHRNMRPAVRTIPHEFEVNIVYIDKR